MSMIERHSAQEVHDGLACHEGQILVILLLSAGQCVSFDIV